jgi:hypothetical protein
MLKFLKKTSLYILALPLLLTVLGAASNQIVLIANHDTFPVMLNEKKTEAATAEQKFVASPIMKPQPAMEDVDGTVMLDDVHCVMTHKTHLNAMADVFDLGNIYSIGDFGLILGDWLWVFAPFVFVFDVTRKLAKQD